ncbi:MAG: 4Fe-4S binding protein [Deltaproteobacteria bacterium]|nr:4Fe-4S binding protein [Deltaproteobacteria bacterium]
MKKGFIKIDSQRCKGCGLCVSVCPKGRIRIAEALNLKGYHPAEFQEDEMDKKGRCNACTLCALICPDVAIEVFRE